jgi:hypothetical protein
VASLLKVNLFASSITLHQGRSFFGKTANPGEPGSKGPRAALLNSIKRLLTRYVQKCIGK